MIGCMQEASRRHAGQAAAHSSGRHSAAAHLHNVHQPLHLGRIASLQSGVQGKQSKGLLCLVMLRADDCVLGAIWERDVESPATAQCGLHPRRSHCAAASAELAARTRGGPSTRSQHPHQGGW